MVAVAADHRTQITLVPGREVPAVVVRLFPRFPAVERLDDHEHPRAVAEVEQLGRGRVVA